MEETLITQDQVATIYSLTNRFGLDDVTVRTAEFGPQKPVPGGLVLVTGAQDNETGEWALARDGGLIESFDGRLTPVER